MNENQDEAGRARELFRKAYQCQMQGDTDRAIDLYTASIAAFPTAEAYTYRAWAISQDKKFGEAIDDCKRAIQLDPEYGNPYNDIGAYLIELGRPGEAEEWLQQAIDAPRYEARHFAHFNLGRVFEKQGKWLEAVAEFRKAYDLNNNYRYAAVAFQRLQARLN